MRPVLFLYPATNARYREQRSRFGKGGDYLSYSDIVQMPTPGLSFVIPEIVYRNALDKLAISP